MIGTTKGLYSRDVLGTRVLFEEVEVSALATENEEALWVGTDGEGLYRWDGSDFKKRYLQRDSTLFDHVTAIDYNHAHLYLGTTEAMYVFDGGRWSTVGPDEGLPAGEVTSIDASDWVVYVGTTNGLASYFNREISPIERFTGDHIGAIEVSGRRIVVATADEGLVLKLGPAYRILVAPSVVADSALAELSLLL